MINRIVQRLQATQPVLTPQRRAEILRGWMWGQLRQAYKEQQTLLEQGQQLPVRQTRRLAQVSRRMDRMRRVIDRPS